MPDIETDKNQHLVEAFAVAQMVPYGGVDHLLASILTKPPPGSIYKLIELPDTRILELDVSVVAEDIDIFPSWRQKLYYVRDTGGGLLEFQLYPSTSGHKSLRVDFYHGRHRLQSLLIEVHLSTHKQF